MDKTLITNFITQVNELMENNTKLSNLLILSQTEIDNLKNELEQKNQLINTQTDNISELNSKIKKLESDNNEKSSKSIWEGTQEKIKEKDDEIESLKKNIEFLKRQQAINPKQEVKSEKPKKKEKLVVHTQNIVISNIEKEDNNKINKKTAIEVLEVLEVLEKPKSSELNYLDDLDELERELMAN